MIPTAAANLVSSPRRPAPCPVPPRRRPPHQRRSPDPLDKQQQQLLLLLPQCVVSAFVGLVVLWVVILLALHASICLPRRFALPLSTTNLLKRGGDSRDFGFLRRMQAPVVNFVTPQLRQEQQQEKDAEWQTRPPQPPISRHHHQYHPQHVGSNNKKEAAAATTKMDPFQFRKEFEKKFDPNDFLRIQKSVQDLRVDIPGLFTKKKDVPEIPPSDQEYPQTWPLIDILKHWNPNQVQIPAIAGNDENHNLYHSLYVLDWNVHSPQLMEAYRKAEIPFVLQNHPEILRAAERWNTRFLHPDDVVTLGDRSRSQPYLVDLLQKEPPQRNEYAVHSNHLAFWRGNHVRNPPTQNVPLTITEWWQRAMALERALEQNTTSVTAADHYYFRFAATFGNHAYMYEELPIFKPLYSTLFMPEPEQERGINCRFGMVGSTADNHFDATRNWIVVLAGQRRYILSPPEQCQNLNLQPLTHMSARHSKGNWGDPQSWIGLEHARALQVVMQPGDALYLPTSWFHFIVSLTTTFQCNARSGTTQTKGSKLFQIFDECGFGITM